MSRKNDRKNLSVESTTLTKLPLSTKLFDSISKIKRKYRFVYLKDKYLVFVDKKNSEENRERSDRLRLI